MNTQPGIAEDCVVAEVEIAAPPERVFQALTTGEELMRWWISPTCELEMWKIDPRPRRPLALQNWKEHAGDQWSRYV